MHTFILYLCNDVESNPGPVQNLDTVHLNVRSIRNKTSSIEVKFVNHDIICITETHLNPLINNTDIQLHSLNSNPCRKDRIAGPVVG